MPVERLPGRSGEQRELGKAVEPGQTEEPGQAMEPGQTVETGHVAEPCRIEAAWRRLAAAARMLRRLSAAERAARLGDWCRGWLDPADPYRREALQRLPAATGLSAADIARALDAAFTAVDRQAILAVLERELGRIDALERWAPDATGTLTRACPPERLLAVMAGNVPTAGLPVIVAALAVGVPLLVRCSRREPHFVPLAAASLAARLGWSDAVVPAWWPHGSAGERAALATADAAVLFGADQTVAELRQGLGAKTRLLPYGHRFSLAALDWNRAEEFPGGAHALADAVAHDVAAFERAGCLSPLALYVEGDAAACAAQLAGALARLDATLPAPRAGSAQARAGAINTEAAAKAALRAQWLGEYELRAAAGEPVAVRSGDNWAVLVDADPKIADAPPGRSAWIKPVASLEGVGEHLGPLAADLQAVALWAPGREARLAAAAARWGANRICPPGRLQAPPFGWHHDGGLVVGSLVRWADWEPARV